MKKAVVFVLFLLIFAVAACVGGNSRTDETTEATTTATTSAVTTTKVTASVKTTSAALSSAVNTTTTTESVTTTHGLYDGNAYLDAASGKYKLRVDSTKYTYIPEQGWYVYNNVNYFDYINTYSAVMDAEYNIIHYFRDMTIKIFYADSLFDPEISSFDKIGDASVFYKGIGIMLKVEWDSNRTKHSAYFINDRFEMVGDAEFNSINLYADYETGEAYYICGFNTIYDVYSENAEPLFKRKYDWVYGMRGGITRVTDNGYYYYVDSMGESLGDGKYLYAWDFKNGIAPVIKDGEPYFIDCNGARVRDFEAAARSYGSDVYLFELNSEEKIKKYVSMLFSGGLYPNWYKPGISTENPNFISDYFVLTSSLFKPVSVRGIPRETAGMFTEIFFGPGTSENSGGANFGNYYYYPEYDGYIRAHGGIYWYCEYVFHEVTGIGADMYEAVVTQLEIDEGELILKDKIGNDLSYLVYKKTGVKTLFEKYYEVIETAKQIVLAEPERFTQIKLTLELDGQKVYLRKIEYLQ